MKEPSISAHPSQSINTDNQPCKIRPKVHDPSYPFHRIREKSYGERKFRDEMTEW